MNYRQDELVYYQRTNDKVDCFLRLESNELKDVVIKANDYYLVKRGDALMCFMGLASARYYIFSEDDGYFVNHASGIDWYNDFSFHSGYHLYTIYKSLDVLQRECFASTFITGEDSFTKKPFIKTTMGFGDKYGLYIGGLYLRIEYSNGKHILNVDYCSKKYQFTKKNSLHLLLDDGCILSFSNFKRPIKYSGKYYSIDNKDYSINMTTSVELTDQDINALASKKCVKCQLLNDEGTILNEMGLSTYGQPHMEEVCKRGFQQYFAEYLSLYNGIKVEVKEDEVVPPAKTTCYVYLMIDTTNNFYKIGISNNPKYREHTLQSDKPTIELLCAKEYPSRVIAETIESSLHKVYAGKRIRGEWFNLDASDVDEIKQTLK